MATFSFEVPDWVVPATRTTPATFVPALRLAAAMVHDIVGGRDEEEPDRARKRIAAQRPRSPDS